MFLCCAFPTKSHTNSLTVGQTACFCSLPTQRDGQRPLLLLSAFPHWGLMSLSVKKRFLFCSLGHLWSRRSDGSSSCAESTLNNGATALDPLTPSASARHGNDKNKQKHKRRNRQDVLAALSSGGAEPGLGSTA